jgi:hypothetical protein
MTLLFTSPPDPLSVYREGERKQVLEGEKMEIVDGVI